MKNRQLVGRWSTATDGRTTTTTSECSSKMAPSCGLLCADMTAYKIQPSPIGWLLAIEGIAPTSQNIGIVRLLQELFPHSFYSLRSLLNVTFEAQFRYEIMREKGQELQGELVEEQAEEWRPQTNGWPNSANDFAPKTQLSALDRTITICVIKGRRSVRTTHRLTKPKASIGNVSGGADMRIDDPGVSPMHCAVTITKDGVRLSDLDSANGTYVDDERIHEADLENLSA